jgi:hypothetical protein
VIRRAMLALLLALTACAAEEARAPEGSPQRSPEQRGTATKVAAASSPAGAGAAEPFLFAGRDGVILSWIEPAAGGRSAVRFARNQGGTWSAPRTIVERDDLFVNWADFPSVVEDERGVVYAHWLQKSGAATYAYDVRMAISRDGGGTWSEPFLLNRDGTQTEHGFASLAPLPGGGVGALWLDGRTMQSDGGHGHGGGDMALRYARVAADGTIASEEVLDARTCECCSTGLAIASAGPIAVYRDRSADEVRDISFARRQGPAWTAPQRLHADGWRINGCPVNGPQIDASGTTAVAAWFAAAGGAARVYAAFSTDGGATFGAPVVVDDGRPIGRVDVVLAGENRAVVSWIEEGAAGGQIRARLVAANGPRQPSLAVAETTTARSAGFPRVARSGDDVWFAWTEDKTRGGGVRIARAAFGAR